MAVLLMQRDSSDVELELSLPWGTTVSICAFGVRSLLRLIGLARTVAWRKRSGTPKRRVMKFMMGIEVKEK